MRVPAFALVPSLLCALLYGCGGGEDSSGRVGAASSGEFERALRHAHASGQTAFEDVENLLVLAIDTALQASALAGQAVTTGRVDQSGGAATYTPTNGPELVFVGRNGNNEVVEVVFTIETLEGQGASGSDVFNDNHNLGLSARMSNLIDVSIRSQRQGVQWSATVEGTLVHSGDALQLNLTRQAVSRSEVDSTGYSSETDQTTTGTIQGPGFAINLDQSFVVGAIGSSQGDASTSTSEYRHTIEQGGDIYRFDGVRIRRNFRDGVPNLIAQEWRAEGLIRRNEGEYAHYELAEEVVDRERGQGFVVVWVRGLPEDIAIERWQRIP